MPLNIRNEEVNRLAERLAERTKLNKTQAVKRALQKELQHLEQVIPLSQRLRPLQERVLSRSASGLVADKDFYDDLSGEP
jgi:antitoxin VapB